jgi:hypothetical protein
MGYFVLSEATQTSEPSTRANGCKRCFMCDSRGAVLNNALQGAVAVKERIVNRGIALRAFMLAVERGSTEDIVNMWETICDLEEARKNVVVLRSRESAISCYRALLGRLDRESIRLPLILSQEDADAIDPPREDPYAEDAVDLLDDIRSGRPFEDFDEDGDVIDPFDEPPISDASLPDDGPEDGPHWLDDALRSRPGQ